MRLLFFITLYGRDPKRLCAGETYDLAFIHPMMTGDEEERFYKNDNAHVKARGVVTQGTQEELNHKSLVWRRKDSPS
jgi:hypothetical protein